MGSVRVLDAIASARVVPVITIDSAEQAPGVCAALVEGGLPVVEITLRTDAALEGIRRAVGEVPDAIIGAGSVCSAKDAAAVIDAGARFIVSPGLDEGVIASALERSTLAVPGIATPTELMRAIAVGVNVVKLFPAETLGGIAMIRALAAVWPDVRFMPTGGISPANVCDYLALAQVVAVGGSWLTPKAAIDAGDWARVAAAATECRALIGQDP